MSKLILVRHGESSGNRERIFAVSPHDQPLTELGYRQAHEAARRISQLFRPELVVTSAYLRASETARIIAGALGVPLEIEPNLHEREIGAHRGRPYDSFLAEPDYDPQRPWAWKPQGGESYEEVQARVGPILDRLAAAHTRKDVVVVSPKTQVEVDFVANNPGPTLFHCHQQMHMDYGFMTMLEYV